MAQFCLFLIFYLKQHVKDFHNTIIVYIRSMCKGLTNLISLLNFKQREASGTSENSSVPKKLNYARLTLHRKEVQNLDLSHTTHRNQGTVPWQL